MRFVRIIAMCVIGSSLVASVQAQAATFTFSFNTYVAGYYKTVEGFVENAVDGNNFGFDLAATITKADDAAFLGGGYKLLYLHGSGPNPAFIIQDGKVIFSDAIFGRTTGSYDETLGLYTGNPYTYLYRTNGTNSSSQFATSPLSFGEVITAPASVPEPATWATLLIGLGVTGSVMRRHRRLNAKVAPSHAFIA